MALGKSNIEKARQSLDNIANKLASAQDNNESFLELFNDVNFQKFVSETNKGTLLNDQLVSLKKWINSMCVTVEDLKAKTELYLNNQETLNK